jgi:hypothetical protein
MTFLLPVCLATLLLAVFIIDPEASSFRYVIVAAVSVALMSLNGAVGLLLAPLFSVWLAVLAVRNLIASRSRRLGYILAAGVLVCGILCLAYFIGFVPAGWRGRPPDAALWTTAFLRLLALAFGPAARNLWNLSIPVALALVLLTLGFIFRDLLRARTPAILSFPGKDLLRSGGLLTVIAAGLLTVGGLSFGRARLMVEHFQRVPTEYALFSAPMFMAIYAYWSLRRSSHTLRGVVPAAMCLFAASLFPLNMGHGLKWLSERHEISARARKLAESGPSAEQFASATAGDLLDFVPLAEYTERVRFMQERSIAPFRSPVTAVTQPSQAFDCNGAAGPLVQKRARVRVPGAASVEILVGMNRWNCVPSVGLAERQGQLLKVRLARTAARDEFEGVLQVPPAAELNIGIQARPSTPDSKAQLWREFNVRATAPLISFTSPVGFDDAGRPVYFAASRTEPKEVRVTAPVGIKSVELFWGIDDPWAALDSTLRPPQTTMRGGTMVTRLQPRPDPRFGQMFTATLPLPYGSHLSCGINALGGGSGLIQLAAPLWMICPPGTPDVVVHIPQNLISAEIGPYMPTGKRQLATMAALLVLWAVLWLIERYGGHLLWGGRIEERSGTR